jgi:hypothetical protein
MIRRLLFAWAAFANAWRAWQPVRDVTLSREPDLAPKPEHPYNPDPVNAMAVLIGESITDDVEAWDYVPGDRKCLRVTRDGVDFIVRVERATEEA